MHGKSGRIALTLAMLSLTAVAWATHDEPGRGRGVRLPLVTAYAPCTNPNTASFGSPPIPACAPPVRIDPGCSFQAPDMRHGSGKMSAFSLANGDIQFKASVNGLYCEGFRLCAAISFRASSDRCQIAPCTFADIVDYVADTPDGCCIVHGGVCRLRTTVNTVRFDTIQLGDRAGVELLGCGLKRMDGPNVPTGLSFRCGTLAGPLSQ